MQFNHLKKALHIGTSEGVSPVMGNTNSTMKLQRLIIAGVLLVFHSTLDLQLSTAFAQGSLAPPGPPAPMMKTLDQIGPQNSPLSTNGPRCGCICTPRTGNLPDMPTPPMPRMPPDFGRGAGVGPQPGPGGGMPAMPMMPMMPMPRAELKATDQTTNLLGYLCTHYELKQRGEIRGIWATDQLLPFQPYLANQPHRFARAESRKSGLSCGRRRTSFLFWWC